MRERIWHILSSTEYARLHGLTARQVARKAGTIPGAHKSGTGRWQIPVGSADYKRFRAGSPKAKRRTPIRAVTPDKVATVTLAKLRQRAADKFVKERRGAPRFNERATRERLGHLTPAQAQRILDTGPNDEYEYSDDFWVYDAEHDERTDAYWRDDVWYKWDNVFEDALAPDTVVIWYR